MEGVETVSPVCAFTITYPVQKATAVEGAREGAIELPTGKKPQLLALGAQGTLKIVCGTCLKLQSCKA